MAREGLTVDLSHPEYAILGENRARVLHRLAVLAEPASGRRLHDLSGNRSLRTTQRVLDDLVDIGLVDRQVIGAAHAYSLNRQHVLWGAIESILAIRGLARSATERAILEAAAGSVAGAVIYGSVARGEATRSSDLDILLVWADGVTPAQRETVSANLEESVRRLTGNRVQLLAVTADELAVLIDRGDPLIESIRAEGAAIIGGDMGALLHQRATALPATSARAERN